MKIFSILILALFLVSCVSLQETTKQETRYDGRSEWLISWRYVIENKCHITLAIHHSADV